MLPGAAQALAVGQGCKTLLFGVFGPSGAAAVLAQFRPGFNLHAPNLHSNLTPQADKLEVICHGHFSEYPALVISRRRPSH